MNTKRLKDLLEFLKKLPEEEFKMRSLLITEYFSACGTITCVARWCVEENGLSGSVEAKGLAKGFLTEAKRFLELGDREYYFLFIMAALPAGRSDAITRLEWLLEHGSTVGYPIYKESWVDVLADVRYLHYFDELYRLGLEFSK